jgi:creatinine amidohydrolase/Fe(II)-dependent formamide hydrolase-like protein
MEFPWTKEEEENQRYLQYTHPGDWMMGRGTIQVSPAPGLAYLTPIARSLRRQGFKRQVYVRTLRRLW